MNNQFITRPFGVSTYGSAIIRIEPDFASLNFAVRHVAKQPAEAYRQADENARNVRDYLLSSKIVELASSKPSLDESHRFEGNKPVFDGYRASIQFRTFVRDLTRLTEITIGIIEAGVNQIEAPTFQSTRLRELRVQARQLAVQAARNKAQVYCEAAGAKVGKVVHIEDVNPDGFRVFTSGNLHREQNTQSEGDEESSSLGTLPITAAVWVSFAFSE